MEKHRHSHLRAEVKGLFSLTKLMQAKESSTILPSAD